MERRITVATSESTATDLPTDMVIFTDAWGEGGQRFDPEQFSGLPADLRASLVGASKLVVTVAVARPDTKPQPQNESLAISGR